MAKNTHVVPRPNGWGVITEGASRASALTRTQAEAIVIGRQQAARNGRELIIHRPNGQIRATDSHGRDPRNIPG